MQALLTNHRHGEAHGRSKYSEAQIRAALTEIDAAPKETRLARGQRARLAKKTGLSIRMIDHLVKGSRWSYLVRSAPVRPHVDLVRYAFDIDDQGTLVWRFCRRLAVVTDVFTRGKIVIFGFYTLHAADVAHVLMTGDWPDGAADIPDPSIRRQDFEDQRRHLTMNAPAGWSGNAAEA